MGSDLLKENVVHTIPTQELERRWVAVRDVMTQKKVDFLLLQNSEDYLGGYVKWFTDMPAVHGYPVSVIYPAADGMTALWHGSSHPKDLGPAEYLLGGVEKRITMPIMLSLDFTCSFAAEKVVKELKVYWGAIEGVAGPEAANNAAAQTSFIPILTLGLPSNATMALMIGALMMQGLHAGPQLMRDRPELFWGLVASMWVGNVMLVILNLPLVGIWAKCLTVPYRCLYPGILLITCVGVYSISTSALGVALASIFGLAGYLFNRLQCEPAPLLLGVILGPMIEENLRRALLISHGDVAVFVQRPISLTFLIMTVGLIVVLVAPMVRSTRERAFQEQG